MRHSCAHAGLGLQPAAARYSCFSTSLSLWRSADSDSFRITSYNVCYTKLLRYLDTAWPYHDGQSEPVLGKALRDGYREKVKVATKLPTWLVKSREDMDTFLNAQLERLGTDHIDYYLIHALSGPSWETIKQLGVEDFLDTARKDGRIINPVV